MESLLFFFISPWGSFLLALILFIMAGHFAGRYRPKRRTARAILWLTPSLWLLLAAWNARFTRGAGVPIRIDLLLLIPLLLVLTLCSLVLLANAITKAPPKNDDAPE